MKLNPKLKLDKVTQITANILDKCMWLDRSPILSSSDRVVRHSDEEEKTMKPFGVQK